MTREELLKIAKPILFNTDMVRATLDGRKTATRRALKHPFEIHPNGYITKPRGNERLCPYEPPYRPGDILYVRESVFQGVGHYLDVSGETIEFLTDCFEYYADGKHKKGHWKDKYEHVWMYRRPSIHMPKKAARIFLKVKYVRVERLQDMDWRDALCEGVNTDFERGADGTYIFDYDPLDDFWELWNSTIKKTDLDLYGWDANPWVWVIEFERMWLK